MRKINKIMTIMVLLTMLALGATMLLTAREREERLRRALQIVQTTSTAVCVIDTPDSKVQGDFVDALLNYKVEWEKGPFSDVSRNYSSPADVAKNVGVKCQQAIDLTEGLVLEDRTTSP
jgi:hypothetical protein